MKFGSWTYDGNQVKWQSTKYTQQEQANSKKKKQQLVPIVQ